jgi:uncharacterized protein (TIGR04222 family)
MDLGLSTLSSDTILSLYVVLIGVAVAASFMISLRLRPEGQCGAVASMEELAILSGGRTRFVEAIAAKLIGNKRLELLSNGEFNALKPDKGTSSAERAVLRQPSPFKWSALVEAGRADGLALEENMVRKGWLMNVDEAARLRLYQTMPFLALVALGLVFGKLWYEAVLGLAFFMTVTAAAGVTRFFFFDRRTTGGRDCLEMSLDKFSRLKRAPENSELGHAVALFGTAVLVGTSYAALHAFKAQQVGGGGCGTTGGNDNGGDSGCGGGGCGGCGG